MSDAPLPPVAFFTQHTVADYEVWRKSFDSSQHVRKAASALGHHVNRGADNPNLVAIYMPATDRKAFEALLSSPQLKEAMQKAGATSAHSTQVLKPIENHIIGDRATAGVIVTAEVEDFAAWKKGYDAGAALRSNHGIIGHAVNQLADHPNTVVVYHQGESVQALRTFFASAELKAAMKGGGVKGAPKVEFFNGTGGMVIY